jgi:hypothetical protein
MLKGSGIGNGSDWLDQLNDRRADVIGIVRIPTVRVERKFIDLIVEPVAIRVLKVNEIVIFPRDLDC